MRAAITATEGWSSSQVNQDTNWDIPTSPEPSDKEPPATVVAWKLPGVNNGLDVWQANLRNGGVPAAKAMDAQWSHHIPQSNLGGTWGEDDDSAQANSMWTGAPSGPPGPPGPPGNHWGGGGGPAGPGGMWPGGPGKKDDWGGHKPWEARGPNGDGWGNKPPGPWTGGPPQHGPGTWGGDHSPPMPRRPIGFDDWGERSRPGNKRGGGGGGGGWKELPGGPGRAGLPGGPPAPHMLSRMPPGPPDHKGVDPWGRPPRNGWGEAPPGPVSGWGGDDGPAGWAAKPKTPTMPGGWAEPDMDWAKAGRAPGMHTGSKGAMYDKFRTLTDQGFKVGRLCRGGRQRPAAAAHSRWARCRRSGRSGLCSPSAWPC
ncbi:protein Gawky-like [Pollicipes pollicipes]|uniref:protein Gawky-like n=1 Tax=Pollicipes pollicipes TaxID=41117 RepID=UPI0018851CCF|nr:protein Gawky-like [Pollicipes pollicipes]